MLETNCDFKSGHVTDSSVKAFSRSTSIISTVAAVSIFIALAGCASAPIPSEQFAISQSAIDSATAAGASEFAPLEIKSARDKLAAAQKAVEKKEYEAAAALAEESSVDAKLAQVKSETEKAQKSVSELDDHLRTLLDEVKRNSQQQIQSEQKLQSGSGS